MVTTLALLTLLADGPRVAWRPEAGPTTVVVEGLDRATLDALRDHPERRSRALRVAVEGDEADRPPMLGAFDLRGDSLVFTPKFPLSAGVNYVATCEGAPPSRHTIPLPTAGPRAGVAGVDPEADELPENLLKFYIRFDAPMGRGNSYNHIRLLNSDNTPVEAPFLELGEELWDPGGTRFTLLLDPGRIKRGLVPRAEDGPILAAGKSYTLEVDAAWPDDAGRPLRSTYRKTFRATKAVEVAVDPRSWRLSVPRAGTSDPLEADLGRPLDRALLQRLVGVEDADGRPIAGRAEVLDRATRWRFRPDLSWSAAEHRLAVGADLEDLAGNSVARPFELDAFGEISPKSGEPSRITFRPTAK